MDYSPWFHLSESRKSFEKKIPPERASQEEQNGANFSFVAPSSEELLAYGKFSIHCGDDLYHACTLEVFVSVTPHWNVLRRNLCHSAPLGRALSDGIHLGWNNIFQILAETHGLL